MSDLQSIASILGARKSGAGYMGRCPTHEDRNPSLSFREKDGRILAHCHAGCPQQFVIAALRDLGAWPEREVQPREQRRIVATYDYTDGNGAPLYQVVRYHPKSFAQRYPDGRGGWIWRKHPNQVLYHLREVLEAPIVFVVEGEKDVETLRSYGFVATTNAGGANAPWLDSYTETLAGREVIIIPDTDAPGYARAKVIARALIGRAARIRIIDLKGEAKDITEWFERGHSECELIAILEGVHAV